MAGLDMKIEKLEASKKKEEDSGPPDWKVGQKRLEWLMTAIVSVLFIGFAGMFVAVAQMMVDSLKDSRGSSKDFSNQIQKQEEKIDALTKNITTLTEGLKRVNEPKTIQETN